MSELSVGDKERFQASMTRLWEIYKDIGAVASEVSTWRCPYKNAKDRCTAGFGCRNQSFVDGPNEMALCTGSDKLDYQSAWEL
jgi:hypothetical protein